MADERDEIRARIDIVELVGQRVVLKKAGRDWKGLCPFHADKNPSFSVNPTLQRFKCWSCDAKGDIFDWVMRTENVEFAEALQILASKAGVTLGSRKPKDPSLLLTQQSAMREALVFFRQSLQKSSEAKSYCDRRGLDESVREAWEIGYAPDVGDALATYLKKGGLSLALCKTLFLVDEDSSGGYFDKFRGRIMFPIRDERGELVAFGGRVLGDGIPKYINSSDTPLYRKSRVLYGLHRAKQAMGEVRKSVLVEGYLDVIACHRAGVETAIASLGTSMAEDQAKLLKRWSDEVSILYDSDAAGQKAADRAAEMLQAQGMKVRVALMPQGEDPDTLLRTSGAESVRMAVEGGISPLEHKIMSIEKRLDASDDAYWAEVVEALADARTPIELDSHVERIAPKYPGTKDRIHAQKMLRNWVARVRKARKTSTGVEAAPLHALVSVRADRPELLSSEATLLKALLSDEHRSQAWSALQDGELVVTPIVAEVTAAIGSLFGEHGPDEAPSIWLAKIEQERLRDILVEVDARDLVLSKEFIEDAIKVLQRKRLERQVDQSRREGFDNLNRGLSPAEEDAQRRLRELKGVP